MDQIALIFVCLLGGILLKRLPAIPEDSHKGINFFIIYISLPAVTLLYIPYFQLNIIALIPITVSFIIFGFAWLIFKLLQKKYGWTDALTACLTLTCGLGNTSFVGFPLIESYFGKEGLPTAVIIDQGSFLMLASAGLAVAIKAAHGKVKSTVIVKKIVLFPQFIAFIIALFFLGKGFGELAESVFSKLAATLVPLALVSVGLQIQFSFKEIRRRYIALGLSYKLILAPIIIFIFFKYGVNDISSLSARVSVMEAAMAPMITASILASQYKLEAPLAQMITSIGILLSFGTTYLWWIFLGL
jgi:predicted permease